MNLPDVQPESCAECPWRRESAPGWLGPHTAEEWVAGAHGEGPIACHMTIVADANGDGDWDHPDMRQCHGAATFRSNVCKRPHDPNIALLPADQENFFKWNDEFFNTMAKSIHEAVCMAVVTGNEDECDCSAGSVTEDREREADADYSEGRFETFDDVGGLLGDLDSVDADPLCPHGCYKRKPMRWVDDAWYCPKCGDEWPPDIGRAQ